MLHRRVPLSITVLIGLVKKDGSRGRLLFPTHVAVGAARGECRSRWPLHFGHSHRSPANVTSAAQMAEETMPEPLAGAPTDVAASVKGAAGVKGTAGATKVAEAPWRRAALSLGVSPQLHARHPVLEKVLVPFFAALEASFDRDMTKRRAG